MDHAFDVDALVRDGVVYDSSGDKIGKVGQIYLDDQTGEPEWVTVSTGFFGTSESFVPLRGATTQGSELHVPHAKSLVKDAPRVDADEHLSPKQEQELFRYYGGTEERSTADAGVGTRTGGGEHGPGPATTDDTTHGADHGDTPRPSPPGGGSAGPGSPSGGNDEAMTRSEEQLDVHTEAQQTGRARLRKHVVTENVTTTVPVEREEVRLEREPITEADASAVAASGDELTEDEHEVVLTEERVVVDKETVPVERVRLDKEVVTDHEQVSEDLRKEEIEADLPDDDATEDRPDHR